MANYCILCGTELILGGNNMLSDFDDTISEEDDCMVTNATCPKCGTMYEMTDAPSSNTELIGTVSLYRQEED